MAKINLTEHEHEMVLQAITCYIDMMYEGNETHDIVIYEIENGLGSALKKMYKDRGGYYLYKKYVSHRNNFIYPTFEEWKNKRIKNNSEV